jgi:hypothetical protein
MKLGTPTREELLRLEAKYETILDLRYARERGEPLPERAVFKALADEFPGVLKELDTLRLEVVAARSEALGVAVGGGAIERWIVWMVAYHKLFRAALWIKLRTPKHSDLADEQLAHWVSGVTAEFGIDIDHAFVMDVIYPPRGRINGVVLERLELMFGVPAADIQAELFPRRWRR